MATSIKKILQSSRQSWALLAQSAIWISAVLAGFLLPPPAGTLEESKVWVRFAQFIITILIGILLLLALRWNRKKELFRWAIISLSLALAAACFFAYQIFAARWTVSYNNQRVVIGGQFSQIGRKYQQDHPNLTLEDLVFHFAGQVEKIWTRESLQQRRTLLAGMYVLAMPLFAVCIMSLLQAIQCAVSAAPRKKRVASVSK